MIPEKTPRKPHKATSRGQPQHSSSRHGDPPSGQRSGRGMRVGPTSEETRRRVAEARVRQGLSPRIDNPAVIESLALFLRHTFDTLDREPGKPDESDG